MARPRDPHRRTEILDAVIGHLAETGIATLSLRPLAQALGHSTRVLTHHFADKDALLTAVLERLDEIQHGQLRATEGWDDTSRGIGAIVRDSWRRHLEPGNIGATRLIHEIEGLAAAGRLGGRVPSCSRTVPIRRRRLAGPRSRPRCGAGPRHLPQQRLRGSADRLPGHR